MYKDVVAVLHQPMRSASKKHVLHAHLHRFEHLENAHTSRVDKDHCASDAEIAAILRRTKNHTQRPVVLEVDRYVAGRPAMS